jgi:hypothetical protein
MPHLTRFLHFYPAPRALFYYFTIPTQLIASAVSGSGFVLKSPVLSIIGTFLWIIWVVLMFIIVLPQTSTFLNKRTKLLKNSAYTIFAVFFIFGLVELLVITSANTLLARDNNTNVGRILSAFEVGLNYNDGTAMIHQATENLLEGKKPYAAANMVQAVAEFNVPLDRVTILRVGKFADTFPYPSDAQLQEVWQKAIQNPNRIPPEMETKLNYPAGSFLLPAPFMWLGITDLRIIYLLIVLAAIGYTAYLITSPKRFVFIAAALISLDLWNSIANGETGSLAFAFLLLAWVLTGKNLWLSAVFMGIAVITKQTAWFFLPFYLILIYKDSSFKKAGIVAAIIAAIFLVTNLPFMIEDYKLWFISVFTPMSGNMFPAGVGFIALVTGGVLDIRSPIIFDIIEGLVLAGGIAWYLIYFQRYLFMGPLLAILPLLFAWRSLWPYFFYTGIIILASILLDTQPEIAVTPGIN